MIRLLANNMARPDNGIGGLIIAPVLRKLNAGLEKYAVRQCDIHPNHTVLEVGFGPGCGLQAAHQCVKDGNGVIHGVELSEKMIQVATASLKDEISSGKMKLALGTVTEMPYKDNTFDRIFHTNCYYFWPDMNAAVKEIHRVIKADSLMVAVLNLNALKKLAGKNLLQENMINPNRYMEALNKNGFRDVKMVEENKKGGIKIQTIYSTSSK